MNELLNTEIQYLQGVGPKRGQSMAEILNIKTIKDLLYYFPYKYIDRTKFYHINELNGNFPHVQLKGVITSFQTAGKGRIQRLTANFRDETGSIELIWFKGASWVLSTYKPNVEYILYGKPTEFKKRINIAHPELERVDNPQKSNAGKLVPAYVIPEKLKSQYFSSRVIQKLVFTVLQRDDYDVEESLPGRLMHRLKLMPLQEALKAVHYPTNADQLSKARYRLKFEELFYIQLHILKQKAARKQTNNGYVFTNVGDNFNLFYSQNLPFSLTEAQKRVMREIRTDLGSGKQMNRLLQGDVGSGKTLVALMACLIAIDNGYQAALMAPTEILARQHFATIKKFLDGLNIDVALLTGSVRKPERRKIAEGLQSGKIHILVGTHALIEDPVIFNNLGLAIVDEQHRFGVAQRARLWAKSQQPPHILVMTATPIPRTLAMTLYGDLDVSVIDELPPGRKPIQTYHYFDTKRLPMFAFLKKQIEKGRQVYIVYPLISESEKMDYKDLEDGIVSISRAFPPPEYALSVVHGKMKPEEKEAAMQLFTKGQTQIMVATTVIEVGVDVPNASVMVIESAERFGLSQLHQLRGRVGRGAEQSYCILMTSYKLTNEARKRMQTMVDTNDGFVIAETDLKLRGPGDMEGTQQSGIPFDLKIAHLGKDNDILQVARNIASDILHNDPVLQKQENIVLAHQLKKQKQQHFNWGEIS